MTGPSPKGLGDVKLHLVDNVETAGNFISWLGERRPLNAVSVDIETGERPGRPDSDALDPWKGCIRLVQVGDGQQGWAIPWEEWSGVFYQGVIPYTGPLIFHNIAFESKWFDFHSRWKLPWHQAHDTMIMSQVVNPLLSAKLKTLAGFHIDHRSVALQDTLHAEFAKNGWTWGTVPHTYQPYWAYGALDTVLTTRLMTDVFWPQVQPGAVYSIPYELEMAARKIATRMEINGARVDLDYSQKQLDQLTQYGEQVKDWVKKTYGGASVTSTAQMVRVFEGLGGEITEFTNTGGKSLNSDQLEKFVRDGNSEMKNLAETMLKQRKADKLASNYFQNFLENNIDGIVHPSIQTMGARTGRMSIREPALQTLPSDDPVVRRAFIPRNDDWRIISSDLDQVEFRLTASLSKDQALIDLFLEADRTGGDVFTQIMRQVYADDSLQKSDPRRRLIKGYVYGKIYGAGLDKMALTAGVQTAMMKEVSDAFDSNYPGIKSLQRSVEKVGMQRLQETGQAFVHTKTGRRLPADSDRVYSLVNYLIQATAAEVFKQNLVKMDLAGLTENLIVPVHDEIVLESSLADAPDVMETTQECMTTRDEWDVPLTSGVDGPFVNWGEKYEH